MCKRVAHSTGLFCCGDKMPRIVRFDVKYDSVMYRWTEGEDVQDGVLTGFVTLRMRGIKIIEHIPIGMNSSIISLLRSCFRDHMATTEEDSLKKRWPMFFCNGDLRNKCGVVEDFSVRHSDGKIRFSQFYGCECSPDTVIEIPWRSWAISVAEQATRVLRRCPKLKKGVSKRNIRKYVARREELRDRLAVLRKRIRDVES